MALFPRVVALPLALLLCMACREDEPTRDPTVPPNTLDLRIKLDPPAYGYQIRSTPHVVTAGTEADFCDVVKIEPADGEKLVWFNRFESRTSDWTHHMNVLVGPFSIIDAFVVKGGGESLLGHEVGGYNCSDFDDLMESGAFPVYPSQNTHQVAELPPGIAIPGIVPLVMIMNHHYINTTDKDVFIDAAVNFHRVEESKVKHVLTGFFGIGAPIELPPASEKVQAWTCTVADDVTMVAISSHSHARGDCFTMNEYDRDTSTVVMDPFFVNPSWDQPPILFYEPETWVMRKGDGVHWACHYKNRADYLVKDGPSADDEMCIFVGVGYPNKLTVADIKAMVADPLSVNLDEVMADAVVDCKPVAAASPWPVTNTVLARPMERCGGYEATLP